MTGSRSTSMANIRAQCQKVISVSIHDHFGGYEAFAALRNSPDLPRIGPVMAEVFAESIQKGCRVLGAVTAGDLPNVEAFLPDERKSIARAREAVPGITAQTMLEARRIHRTNARAVQDLIGTYATHGPEQARALYQQQTATGDSASNLLMMLWATAITVQRQVQGARPDGKQG